MTMTVPCIAESYCLGSHRLHAGRLLCMFVSLEAVIFFLVFYIFIFFYSICMPPFATVLVSVTPLVLSSPSSPHMVFGICNHSRLKFFYIMISVHPPHHTTVSSVSTNPLHCLLYPPLPVPSPPPPHYDRGGELYCALHPTLAYIFTRASRPLGVWKVSLFTAPTVPLAPWEPRRAPLPFPYHPSTLPHPFTATGRVRNCPSRSCSLLCTFQILPLMFTHSALTSPLLSSVTFLLAPNKHN